MLGEIFLPKIRIPIFTKETIEEYRELYAGKKDIYYSVYEYEGIGTDEIKAENAIIDKIFLDFDYDEDFIFFQNVKKVAKYLYDNDSKFYVRFSGRGFHLFVLLSDDELKNPKDSIRAWVKELHNNTNTTSDSSVVGDTRRVCRMLGTMNMKTHLYCIPIQYSQLMNFTYERICEIAKEYSGTLDYINGTIPVNISSYDTKEKTIYLSNDIDISNVRDIISEYPPCIKSFLSNPELGYYERGQLILYLRDDGYSFKEILMILKSILTEKKYYHCREEENQPEYLYCRDDMMFASCNTLKAHGLCPSDTCTGQHLYL